MHHLRSPKRSHNKANRMHYPQMPRSGVRIFRIFALWNLLRPLLFSGVEKRVVLQKGGFGGCSPGTKTGTRAHSPKPPLYLPVVFWGCEGRNFSVSSSNRSFQRSDRAALSVPATWGRMQMGSDRLRVITGFCL